MKTEYEVRVLEINIEQLIEKLQSLNAKYIGSWLQKRYVYDFKAKKDNKWIRLRTNGKETTLTIKEIKDTTIDGTKELEIVVSDFEATNQILEELGYHARATQENHRIRYMLNDTEIDIDTWPGIPTYVEIEGESADEVEEALKLLNINKEDTTALDVEGIYLHYGYQKSDLDNLKFKEVKIDV